MRELVQKKPRVSPCAQHRVPQQQSYCVKSQLHRGEQYQAESSECRHLPGARKCARPWSQRQEQRLYVCASRAECGQISKPQRGRSYTGVGIISCESLCVLRGLNILFCQAINFANSKAAAAATPPIPTVCNALRNARSPVNFPLIYPKIPSAARVTMAETINPR